MPVDSKITTDYFRGIFSDIDYLKAVPDPNRRNNLEDLVRKKVVDLFLGTDSEEHEFVLNLFSRLARQQQEEIICVIMGSKGEEIKNLLAEVESRKKIEIEIDDVIKKIVEDKIVKPESFEIFGYSGKVIKVDLPRKGAFNGFKSNYFVSVVPKYQEDYKNQKGVEFSISDSGVVSLLEALRSYIKEEYGLQIDPNVDYFSELSKGRYKCRGLDVVKVLKGLGDGKLFEERAMYFIKPSQSYLDHNCVGFGDTNMFFGKLVSDTAMACIFLEMNK